MIGPLRMKFSKKDLVIFGAGMLVMFLIGSLMGAKKVTCEEELLHCKQDLDECISLMR